MESKELAAAERIAAALCAIGVNATARESGNCAWVDFDEFNFRVDDPRGKAGLWGLRDQNKRFLGQIEVFAPKRGCDDSEARKVLERCELWRKKNAEQTCRRAAMEEAEAFCLHTTNVAVSVANGDWNGGLSAVGTISVTVKVEALPQMTAAILKLLET